MANQQTGMFDYFDDLKSWLGVVSMSLAMFILGMLNFVTILKDWLDSSFLHIGAGIIIDFIGSVLMVPVFFITSLLLLKILESIKNRQQQGV